MALCGYLYPFVPQRITIDLYADYNRLSWSSPYHHDRHMIKGMLAYSNDRLTVGVEAFVSTLRNDITAILPDGTSTRINAKALNYSVFMRGSVCRDILGFLLDMIDLILRLALSRTNSLGIFHQPATMIHEPGRFMTFGLDFTPNRNIHIMPNIWYIRYQNSDQGSKATWNRSGVQGYLFITSMEKLDESRIKASTIFVASVLAPLPSSEQQSRIVANNRLDSLIRISSRLKSDSSKVMLLNQISFEYNTISPYDGIRYALQAEMMAKASITKPGRPEPTVAWAPTTFHLADYPKNIHIGWKPDINEGKRK